MTYPDFMLFILYNFFLIISPVMIVVAIYGIYITTNFFCGVLIEFNEKTFLPQEQELSLEERLKIALRSPLDEADATTENELRFIKNYNSQFKGD